MPKVPVYQQNQVQETQLPERSAIAKPSAETFGGGDAGINKAIDAASPIYEKVFKAQKEKGDSMALMEADARLSKLETSLLHDPKVGALNKKGRDAFDVGTTTLSDFDKGAGEISGSLANDEQKLAFEKLRLQRGAGIDRSVQQHIAGETVRYETEITANLVKNEQDAAIKNYKDPARVQASLELQQNAIVKFGQNYGMSDEQIQQQLSNAKSSTHASIISRFLTNSEDLTAQSYYNKFKDQITDGKTLEAVEKELEVGSTRGFAQRFTDKLLKENLDPAEVEKRFEAIGNPKKREAAEQRYSNQVAMRDNMLKKQQEDIFDANMDALYTLKDQYKIDPKLFLQMTPSQQAAFQKEADDLAKGKDKITNLEFYDGIRDLMSNPKTRDATINDPDFRQKVIANMSRTDAKKILDERNKLRFGDEKTRKDNDTYSEQTKSITAIYQGSGLTPKGEDFAKYRVFVMNQVQGLKEQGKIPTTKDVTEIANMALLDVVKERKNWFDKKIKLSEVKVGDKIVSIPDLKYKTIPSYEKIRLEKYLKQKTGKQPSEAAVVEFYRTKLIGGKE